MGGRAFQRQGSLLKYEYLTFLFGTVTCLGFPCAEDLVDPAVNDKYLVISKLPVWSFKIQQTSAVSESSKMYIIDRRFNFTKWLI